MYEKFKCSQYASILKFYCFKSISVNASLVINADLYFDRSAVSLKFCLWLAV